MARINYVELPVATTARAKAFWRTAFGWSFTDYGPDYAATSDLPVNLGLQADLAERTAALLPVVEVADLEAALSAVDRAGGTVTMPIFAFPGGRRFHFRDPDGHEMAAMQTG